MSSPKCDVIASTRPIAPLTIMQPLSLREMQLAEFLHYCALRTAILGVVDTAQVAQNGNSAAAARCSVRAGADLV